MFRFIPRMLLLSAGAVSAGTIMVLARRWLQLFPEVATVAISLLTTMIGPGCCGILRPRYPLKRLG